jgi:hypothetical protein
VANERIQATWGWSTGRIRPWFPFRGLTMCGAPFWRAGGAGGGTGTCSVFLGDVEASGAEPAGASGGRGEKRWVCCLAHRRWIFKSSSVSWASQVLTKVSQSPMTVTYTFHFL